MRKLLGLIALLSMLAACVSAAEDGLVLHFTFDNVSGSSVKDASGQGNHGKVLGGAKVIKVGALNAMLFDGKDDYIECAPTPSLDIKYTGTLEVWFKASPIQGGLICRVTGGAWKDERLVFGFNTHRKSNSLLWAMADGHSVRYVSREAPPNNRWTHAVLTYDGGLVKVFVDGLLVDVRGGTRHEVTPQAINPDIRDVPLYVGRAIGIGKGYFKGMMTDVRVYNRALSEQELFAHFKAKAKTLRADTTGLGKVRMKVHVYADYGLLTARVDVRRLWPLPKGARVELSLLRLGQTKPLKKLETDNLPDYGKARMTLRLPDLAAGTYVLRATALGPDGGMLGKQATTTLVWPKTPDWLRDKNIKMLNNLVFELLDTREAASEYSFHNFRKGFVFISSESSDSAKVFLDSEKQPVTTHVPGAKGPQQAFRYLPEGRHKVRVSGGKISRMIVRAVPQLTMHHLATPHVREFGKYDLAFAKKHLLHALNATVHGHDYGPKHPFPAEQLAPAWVATGRKWYIHTNMPGYRERRAKKPRTISGKEAYKYWAGNRAYANPLFAGFLADEIGGDNHPINDSWRKAALMLKADPKFRGKRLLPYVTSMYPFSRALAYCRALADCGYGMAWKRYLAELPDRISAERGIYAYFDQEMQQWREKQPGVERAMIIVPACFSAPPESVDIYPQANFKVFMDMEINCLANAPAFVGLDGIEEYSISYSDEETVRWIGKLFRHYGIEGKTEMLSTDPYQLAHIQNGDFLYGAKGWTLKPAEEGSIGFRKIKGYGWFQSRYPGRFDRGDFVLVTKRSAKAPNVFSQEIRNLEPGKLYSFRMYTADAGDFAKGKSRKSKYAMSVELENVDELEDRGFQCVFGNCHGMGSFRKRDSCWMNFLWRIFRAKGTTAGLIVSDWKTPKARGGPRVRNSSTTSCRFSRTWRDNSRPQTTDRGRQPRLRLTDRPQDRSAFDVGCWAFDVRSFPLDPLPHLAMPSKISRVSPELASARCRTFGRRAPSSMMRA